MDSWLLLCLVYYSCCMYIACFFEYHYGRTALAEYCDYE